MVSDDRLYESYRRLQKTNAGLEDKLLRVVDKFEGNKITWLILTIKESVWMYVVYWVSSWSKTEYRKKDRYLCIPHCGFLNSWVKEVKRKYGNEIWLIWWRWMARKSKFKLSEKATNIWKNLPFFQFVSKKIGFKKKIVAFWEYLNLS